MDNKKLIVEVAMEIALTQELLDKIAQKYFHSAARESAMTTSVGGIGPLLRERMIAEADSVHEIIGVSLLYEHVWVQRWQPWGQLYLEKRRSCDRIRWVLEKDDAHFSVTMYDGSSAEATVWKARFGKASVFFLECPGITSVIYPGVEDAPRHIKDKTAWYKEARIKQSWFLGRGTLELLKILNKRPDIIVLSETPTLFGWHKIVKDALADDPHFEKTKYVFNDHTPLEYAHPVWSTERLQSLHIDPAFYRDLNNSNNNNHDKVDITQMLVAGVDRVYGVSAIHGNVMRSMPTLKPYADKIQTITNGVSVPFWQHHRFQHIDSLSDEELLAIKDEEKKKLIDWVWKRYKFWSVWKEKAVEKPLILWTRRITGYKRLDILSETIRNDALRKRFLKADVTILLGGRIHQQDGMSKLVVFNLLDFLAEHPDVEDRIAMLDNYNIWEAPRLFRGIDATIMMSDQGKEASATGFMKAQVNGGLVIATSDGAIPESVFFYEDENNGNVLHNGKSNGFRIAYHNGSPTPETFLNAIESFAEIYADKKKRALMIRAAVAMAPRVSIEKCVKEMLDLFNSM